jgi:hypothetical protein
LLAQDTTELRVPDWNYPELRSYLSLTDAQLQALITNQDNRNRALSGIYSQINDKYTALYQLLESEGGTATQLGQMLIDIRNLQRQLPQVDAPYRTQAAAILTADQKNKLPALIQAMNLQSSVWQAQSLMLIDGYPVSLAASGAAEGRLESSPGVPGTSIMRNLAIPATARPLPAVVR